MTATIEETDLSTFEDVPPACDYKEHPEVGDGPAVWALTMRSTMACGCVPTNRIYLLCEGCWAYMHSKAGMIYCRKCWHVHHLNDDILSVVRL